MPTELVKELKHLAVDSEKTLREVMIEACQEYVGKHGRR